MFSMLVAYEMRTKPSPESPKAVPGTMATLCSSSRRTQNSSEVRPEDVMFVNT